MPRKKNGSTLTSQIKFEIFGADAIMGTTPVRERIVTLRIPSDKGKDWWMKSIADHLIHFLSEFRSLQPGDKIQITEVGERVILQDIGSASETVE